MIDLASPDTYTHGMPHEAFRELRATTPVSWQSEKNGRGFWAVTRYHDVISVLRTPAKFSSWRGGVLLADPPAEFLPKLREGMMNRDPPDHTQLRRLVNKVLNPRAIEQLGESIARKAAELVGRVVERGQCDFAADIAGEMPLYMICEILGVPEQDRRALYKLTVRMLGTDVVDPAAALRDQISAAMDLRGYAERLGQAKLDGSDDDLATQLVKAEIDGRRLTPGEFQAFFMLLFNAGTDTTRSLLCYGLDLLLDRPELVARLRADHNLLPQTIEELARYITPVIQIRRTAACDLELGGSSIREGDKVVVFFPSANRDEAVFGEPDRFDIDRSPNDHIAFGFGTHFCLGAPLARLEANHVFREVLTRLQELERITPLVPTRTNFIRGVRSLPISYAGR